MLGRGVPSWRGEGSYNKSLIGHDITPILPDLIEDRSQESGGLCVLTPERQSPVDRETLTPPDSVTTSS